jgi:SAM-dependent methyltransferase
MGLPLEVARGLVCPSCQKTLTLVQEAAAQSATVTNGHLSCAACRTTFSISNSVPRFCIDLQEQEKTARTFGFEWKAFWKGFFDKGDVFGLSFNDTAQYFLASVGLAASDLKDAKVLDAGTGSGRIPMILRDTGCKVYAVDIHDSLGLVAATMNGADRTYFFQADLMNLPFEDGFFDAAWSSGVIHHTPDPRKAFGAIARKVKPGGRFFVSVYGKDRHHYRLFRHFLPFAPRLPVSLIYLLAAVLALPLFLAFNGALFMVRALHKNEKPPYRFLGFMIENIGYKSYGSIVLNLFDQLHPRYQSEHTVDEVQEWFKSNGFRETVVTESVGMVGIRGIKSRS